MYSTSDFKKGLIVELDGAPCMIENIQVSTPTARGATTIHKVRLRNLKTKQKIDKSFRGGDMLGVPDFERRPCQYLYREQDTFHFMDQESFDQFFFSKSDIEWETNFLIDDLEGIHVPDLQRGGDRHSDAHHRHPQDHRHTPSMKGASATARTKPRCWKPAIRFRCRSTSVPTIASTSTPAAVTSSAGLSRESLLADQVRARRLQPGRS